MRLRRHRARDDRVDVGRNPGKHIAKARRIGQRDLGEHRDHVVTPVGANPSDELEGEDPERELIARMRERLAPQDLLGRHIPGRSDDETLVCQARLAGRPGDAEVDHGGAEVPVERIADEHVRRLHVAMDAPEPMHRFETGGDLGDDLHDAAAVEWAVLLTLCEVGSFEPFDGDEGPAVFGRPVAHQSHDVLARDRPEQALLASEPIVRRVGQQRPRRSQRALDGDGLSGRLIEGAVHLPGRALAGETDEGEAPPEPSWLRHDVSLSRFLRFRCWLGSVSAARFVSPKEARSRRRRSDAQGQNPVMAKAQVPLLHAMATPCTQPWLISWSSEQWL